YLLTVTNPAGTSVSRQVTVAAVPAPTITSFTAANNPATINTSTTLTASFSGGTATIDQNIGPVTSGSAVSTANLTADTTYTLTVTNAAGASVTQTLTVTVVPAPVITSLTADRT